MGTGATYQIYDQPSDMTVFFHNKDNNNPIEAARLFHRMRLDFGGTSETTPGYASSFFRANPTLEFMEIACHDYADDEYTYNFLQDDNNPNKMIFLVERKNPATQVWETDFMGTLDDFIKRELGGDDQHD